VTKLVSISSLREQLVSAASEFAGQDSYDVKRILAARRRRDELVRIAKGIPGSLQRMCDLARGRLVDGAEIDLDTIEPELVFCQSQEDYAVHRYHSAMSAFPTRDRPGRRMKFMLVDAGQPHFPIMAVATLSSAISILPSRDRWIGWSGPAADWRWNRLAYVLDLSTCISVAPYSGLTVAKLMAHLALSRDCQEHYHFRYADHLTDKTRRKVDQYALVVGTGAFKSRTPAYKGFQLTSGDERFLRAGMTEGYSSTHISDSLYDQLMQRFGVDKRFGVKRSGRHVRFSNLRIFARLLNIDEGLVLRPGQRRSVYLAPTAKNTRDFLLGKCDRLDLRRPWARSLISEWKTRWLAERLSKAHIVEGVRRWRAEDDVLDWAVSA
jgi:hypothetical protein